MCSDPARIDAETMQDILDLPYEAANTDDEELDPSFDLNTSAKLDTQHQIETFCEEWVTQLSRDDRYALGIFLQHHLCETVGKSETEAAELAGLMIARSDRTVRDWKSQFYENDGSQRASKASINEQVCCGTMKLLIPRYANMSEKMLLRRVLQNILILLPFHCVNGLMSIYWLMKL